MGSRGFWSVARYCISSTSLLLMAIFGVGRVQAQSPSKGASLEGKVRQVEDWAKKIGVFENYQKFLKLYVTEERFRKLYPMAPPGQIEELLSRGRLSALKLALMYTPEQVVALEASGTKLIYHFIERPREPTFAAMAARAEAVIVGEVVGGEHAPGPDGLRSNAFFVVKEVLSGELKVGDTIRVRQYSGLDVRATHDWIAFNDAGKVYFTHPHRRGVIFLVRKSAPMYWWDGRTIERLMPNGSYMYTGSVEVDGDKLIGSIAHESKMYSLAALRKTFARGKR